MSSADKETRSGRTALMLIDFQRDFLDDGGQMPVARNQVKTVLAAALAAMEEARTMDLPIVAIGNEYRPGDYLMNLLRRNASIAGSKGAAWDARLPLQGVSYFPKRGGDAFGNPAPEPWLKARGVKEVVLTGLFAHACISATAKGASARGFIVRVIANAIADSSDSSRAAALAKLRKRGVATIQNLNSELSRP
jgi:nicotinamidase-related amidase